MKVTGISWLGVGTESFEETVRFFEQVIGLKAAAVDPRGVAMLHLGLNGVVEVFGPGTGGFANTRPPVVAFEVENMAEALAHLAANDVALVGSLGRWNGFEWQYFRGPEDRLYAVKTTPPAGWADDP